MQLLHKRPLSSPSNSHDHSHPKCAQQSKYVRHSEQGLTLVEVLLTTALLSMGLLAVANMQMVSMRVNTTSANLTQATLAAQEVAEWIMSLPFDDPLLMDETDPWIATTYHDPDPPIGYSIRWEVDTSSANSKIVNIVTTWGSIESQKSISLPMQISTYTNPEISPG